MSAEATFWAWMMGVKPAACKLVLLCLADCHNADNGRCDPGGGYIADFTGLDKKTIPDTLKRLELMGLITRRKRAGDSTQYHLHILENPVPPREKGEKKKPVKFDKVDLPNHTRKRVDPELGAVDSDPCQKRVDPDSGIPKNGSTRNRKLTPPENGGGVPPKTGHEPTSNLKGKPTNSDADASGAAAPTLVDNSLGALEVLYTADNPTRAIFDVGVKFLQQFGHAERTARSFLGQQLSAHGEGPLLDAMILTMVYEPVDPTAWMIGCLERAAATTEMALDWAPPDGWAETAACSAEAGGMGIPLDLIRKARDTFVIWFRDHGIRHHDWLDLFSRWCDRDWQRAQQNRAAYLKRLATASGFGEFEHFTS